MAMTTTFAHLARRETWPRMIAAAAPLMGLPPVAYLLLREAPPWQLMWALAFSIYAGSKWFTFAYCPAARDATALRALGYLLLWPGMDAAAFFDSRADIPRPGAGEWLLAAVKLSAGMLLVFVAVPRLVGEHRLAAGWIGMVGLLLTLHFGLFHLFSLGWRLGGVNAQPIMQAPLRASSLSNFWGQRWNLAFRDLSYAFIFRPLVGHLGLAVTTLAVFAVSGLIHELVISVPVRAGWGGPTFYFLLQGFGLLAERSRLGKRLELRAGITGRLFAGVFLLAPIGWLFHEPFVCRAILPTLAALGVH
ncbi:MAG TPA: MBOAT family protein [Pirellulales bacterium]|jgi:hypothetical protein|nr:MBOAT family protein [Pirellulales bacterium]